MARKVYEGQHPPLVVPPPCLALLVTPFLNLKSYPPQPTSWLHSLLMSAIHLFPFLVCQVQPLILRDLCKKASCDPPPPLPYCRAVGHCVPQHGGTVCAVCRAPHVSSGHTTNQRFGHPSAYHGTAWVILGSGQYSSNGTSLSFSLVSAFLFITYCN